METTRRKLLTLLSSIPALGLLGIGGAEAKRKIFYVDVGDLPKEKAEELINRKYKNGSTDVTELPFPSNDLYDTMGKPLTAWEKIERNIKHTEFQSIIERNRAGDPSLPGVIKEGPTPLSIVDVLALNKKIVTGHPSLFATDMIMTAPTCKMFNGHSCGQVITAKSKFMKAEYTVEFALSLKSIYGLDAEEELRNILADEMAIELMRLDDMLKVGEQKSGYALCPYIPVQIIKAVDINTFQPKIRALTMYGVMKL